MFILNGYKFLYAINLMLILNDYKFLYAIDLMFILNDYKFLYVYAIDFYFWTRALSHSSIKGPGDPKRGLIG